MNKQNGHLGGSGDELLRLMHVRSSLWCRSDMRAPWGFAVNARPRAAFHLVVSGSCDLSVEGGADVKLRSGDLAILPHGNAHVARSGPSAKVLLLDDILTAVPPRDGRLTYGGDGAVTDLVCGGLDVVDPASAPILKMLPQVVVRSGSNGEPAADLRDALALVLNELASARPTEAVVTKLTDALLAIAIRSFLRELERPLAWGDPEISVVIAAIDEQPERPWTLIELARVASLSRSAFAERFRETTGESPMRYLARVRLARASSLLRGGAASVKAVADATGFASEASFSRAFRRHFGAAPSDYRDAEVSASRASG